MSYQFYHLQQQKKSEGQSVGNMKEIEKCQDPRLWSNNSYVRHQAIMDDVMGLNVRYHLACNGDGQPELPSEESPKRQTRKKSQSEVMSLKEQISKLKGQLAECQERQTQFRRMSVEMDKDVKEVQRNKASLEKTLEEVRQELERVKKKGDQSLKKLTEDHAKKMKEYEALRKRVTTDQNDATELLKKYQKRESLFPTLENEIRGLKQKLAEELKDRRRSQELEKAFKATEATIRSEYEEKLRLSNEVNEENMKLQNESDKLVKECELKIKELKSLVTTYKMDHDRMPELKKELDTWKNKVKDYEEKLAGLPKVEEQLDNVDEKATRVNEKIKRQMNIQSEIVDIKDDTIRELERERDQLVKKSADEVKRLEKERESFEGQLLEKDKELGELKNQISALSVKFNEEKEAAKAILRGSQEHSAKDMEELQKRLEQFEDEAKKEKSKHVSEVKELERQLKELQVETEDYKRQVENAKVEIPRLQQQIEEVKNNHADEVENLRKEYDAQFEAIKRDLEDGKIAELLRQIENLKKQKEEAVAKLTKKMQEEEANQRDLQNKLVKVTKELGKQENSKEAEKQADELSQALSSKELELKELRRKFEETEKEVNDLRQELIEVEQERSQLLLQLNQAREHTEANPTPEEASSTMIEEMQGEKILHLTARVKHLEEELEKCQSSRDANKTMKLRSAFVDLDAISESTDEGSEEVGRLQEELDRKELELEQLRLRLEESGSEKEPLHQAVGKLKTAMQKQQKLLNYEQDKCDKLTQELTEQKQLLKNKIESGKSSRSENGDTDSSNGFAPAVVKNNIQSLSMNELTQLHEMTLAALRTKFEAGQVENSITPTSLVAKSPKSDEKQALLKHIDEDEKNNQKEIQNIKKNEIGMEEALKRADMLKMAIRENPPLTSRRSSQKKGVEKALIRAEMLKKAIRENPPVTGRRTAPKPR